MPSLIYLGAEHGSSRQESLSLQWDDIDFEYDEIGMIKLFRIKNKRKRLEYLMPRTKKKLCLNGKTILNSFVIGKGFSLLRQGLFFAG